MRFRRTVTATLAALVATGLMAIGAPTTAVAADDVKIGTRVAGPNGACADGQNANNSHVRVCFKAYGEKLYVKDKAQDGRSAYGRYEYPYNLKTCRNRSGNGTWVVCDYSIPEGRQVKFRGYTRDNEGTFNWIRDRTSWAYDFS